MNAEEKRKLVEELVALSVGDPVRKHPVRKHPPGAADLFNEIDEKIRQRMREKQINVRLKHFSPEQIVALLDFYATEMGKSILTSQGRISDEIASAMQLITHEVIEETQDKRREEAFARVPEKQEPKVKLNRIDNPKPGWVLATCTQVQGSNKNPEAIPNCSFCNEKPPNLGEVVAGPNLFICRKCVKQACEALKDSGYPVG